jgi:hypothetical protein
MGHVAKIVGGVYITNKHIGQTGNLFAPVPLERQKAAVKFLNDNAFTTPSFMVKPEILNLIESTGSVARVGKAQSAVLTSLLSPGRLARMQELTIHNKNAYSPVDMMSDLRNGIFRELNGAGPVKVDIYRSNLQRTYVDFVGTQLQNAKDSTRALFRGDLIALQAKIRAARAADSATRMHLEDLRDRIAKALDPKFAPPAPQQGGMPMRMGVADEMSAAPTTCWPDYVIQ